MKTENLFMILLFGGIIGFVGAVTLKLIGGVNPNNPTWVFFFSFLGIYMFISTFAVFYNYKKSKVVTN